MNCIERLEATMQGEATDRPPFAAYQRIPLNFMSGESSGTAALALAEFLEVDIAVMPFCYGYPASQPLSFDRPLDLAELEGCHGTTGVWSKQLDALRRLSKGSQGRRWVIQEVPSPWGLLFELAGRDLVMKSLREYPGFVKKALETLTESLTSFVRCSLQEETQGILYRNPAMSFEVMQPKDYQIWGQRYDQSILEVAKDCPLVVQQFVGPKCYVREVGDLPVTAFGWSTATGPRMDINQPRFGRVLWGGLNETMTDQSLDSWRGHVEDVLRDSRQTNWICSLGEPLTPGLSLSKLTALKEAVFSYRRPREPKDGLSDGPDGEAPRRPRKNREEYEKPAPKLLEPPIPPKGAKTRIVEKPAPEQTS
jgi:hypothetical protein